MISFLLLALPVIAIGLARRSVRNESVGPARGLGRNYGRYHHQQAPAAANRPRVLMELDPACRACNYDKARRDAYARDSI